MKKERMEAHKRALAKRYGIERIESFIISARRHQAVLERISIAFCNDESLSDDKKYRRMEIRQESAKSLVSTHLNSFVNNDYSLPRFPTPGQDCRQHR